ncbi:hypothetical protein CB1_000252010 [Camelus ferus]|nr:hypothetical protein CB1_000252010 [Camelus ferus]
MSESEQNEKAICAEGALARGTRAQQVLSWLRGHFISPLGPACQRQCRSISKGLIRLTCGEQSGLEQKLSSAISCLPRVMDPGLRRFLGEVLPTTETWDWSTYLADYGQPNCKYLRVNPVTALTLLEKMKDTSRKNNMFAQFRKNERDKQKLIDTVAKQLRGLVSSHHS